MRALLLCDPPPDIIGSITSDRIVCHPDLLGADDHVLATSLTEHRPNALITERVIGAAALSAWQDAMKREPIVMVHLARADAFPAKKVLPSMYPQLTPQTLASGIAMYTLRLDRKASLIRALAVAERFLQEQFLAAEQRGLPESATATGSRGPDCSSHGSVLMVGAGIVNLITADTLLKAGYQVTIMEAAPDPRLPLPWFAYGCTRGGGNARMFSLTEADDYHDKNIPASGDANLCFDGPPSSFGWDVRKENVDSYSDREWVQTFKRVPAWLAQAYNSDMFGLNRRGGELWDEWMSRHPSLFEASYLRHDVLRLYEDPEHLSADGKRQDDVGATLERYSAESVRERFPVLAEASPKAFAGGILVRGFTVNVHDFVKQLLDNLEAAGAIARFGVRAERLQRDSNDRVTGVITASEMLHYDNYVISAGAYGGSVLRHTRLAGQIHGVLGCWTSVPNLSPRLENSLKVARRGHITVDANMTVGQDQVGNAVLMIGSGYGWTGSDPRNIDRGKLECLNAAVADTVRRIFPRAYDHVGGEPGLRHARQFCVRPWTASNLGLFDIGVATNGMVILTGGHNTGGFAQATVVAEAVLDALRGRRHPMHVLYHPLRLERVIAL